MIAKKHGGNDGFADFEAKFGSVAAENLLQRVCEELYSEGSQWGVSIYGVEYHDPHGLNRSASATVEYEGEWYELDFEDGNSNGTVVRSFAPAEYVASAEELAKLPPEDPRPRMLVECLRAHLETVPALESAGYASVGVLSTRMAKKGRMLSACPEQVHWLLRGVLGDVALFAQDYTTESVDLAYRALQSAETAGNLFGQLSTELKARIDEAAKHCSLSKTPQEFFVAGLEPTYSRNLFA